MAGKRRRVWRGNGAENGGKAALGGLGFSQEHRKSRVYLVDTQKYDQYAE